MERLAKESLAKYSALDLELMQALLAADAWFSQQQQAVWSNPTYQAYYAQHFSWPPELFQDIANLEEQRDQQKADARQVDALERASFARSVAERGALRPADRLGRSAPRLAQVGRRQSCADLA